MSSHSVAEARNQLSRLIDKALSGESVTITRHGRPVVELRPSKAVAAPVTASQLAWLDSLRVGGAMAREDAGTLVSRMRDEEDR